jgi:hypothetical protein
VRSLRQTLVACRSDLGGGWRQYQGQKGEGPLFLALFDCSGLKAIRKQCPTVETADGELGGTGPLGCGRLQLAKDFLASLSGWAEPLPTSTYSPWPRNVEQERLGRTPADTRPAGSPLGR